MPSLEQVFDDFAVLDDWEDRYRYVIELGRELPPFAAAARTAANKVQGCVSQVWLTSDVDRSDPANPILGLPATAMPTSSGD